MCPKIYFLLIIVIPLFVACEHDADAFKIKGIDVSHYQKEIDWEMVSQNKDLHFVFIKATEAQNYQDSIFERNWEGAAKVGLKRGAYHFFRPNVSVEWQIKNFTQKVTLENGDLPPVLDVEDTKNTTMPQLIDKVGKWLIFVEEHYGVKPIIYASLNLYKQYLQPAFPDHLVWIARYNRRAPPKTLNWSFWQYSDREQVKGISVAVDKNVFNGSPKELEQLLYSKE